MMDQRCWRINGGAKCALGQPGGRWEAGGGWRDGTAAGAGITATINAELTGSAQLVKADLGTLILTSPNSYTGAPR